MLEPQSPALFALLIVIFGVLMWRMLATRRAAFRVLAACLAASRRSKACVTPTTVTQSCGTPGWPWMSSIAGNR